MVAPETIKLIYATQTGQSKAIAQDMSDLAKIHGFDLELHCMSTFWKEFSLKEEKYVLFVASTTGDGDAPDVATKFWRLLKKSKDNLQDTSYALLGLGNTNYTNFCNFGKMLDKRLKELNAQPFHQSMWADDAVGLEIVVTAWMDGVINKLLEIFGRQNLLDSPSASSVTPSRASAIADKTTSPPSESAVSKSQFTQDPSINSISSPDSTDLESISPPIDLLRNLQIGDQRLQASLASQEIPREDEIHRSDSLACFDLDVRSTETLNMPSCPSRILEIIPDSMNSKERSTFPLCLSKSDHFFLPSQQTPLALATLKNAVYLTEGKKDVKKILKMEFDISECRWEGEILPGDTVGIVCPNDEQEVDELLELIGVEESQRCQAAEFRVLDEAVAKKKKIILLEDCTMGDLVTWHINIRGVVKKAFLRSLVEVTSNTEERRVLEILCSRQGGACYSKIFVEKRLTILELLKLLPSCKPSLGLLYEHLPRIFARPYSICSLHSSAAPSISIAFSVSEYDAVDLRRRQDSPVATMGLCTGWLYNLFLKWKALDVRDPPIKVAMYLRSPTRFRVPDDPSIPLIMIGPGTGVSPFVGFLQHRSALMKSCVDEGRNLGETWLFVGCRGRDDFIFREELEEFESSGVLTHLQVCFSREVKPDAPRYVQDGMLLHANKLAALLLHTCAKIYVCGDAQTMMSSVNSVLKVILQDHSDLSPKEVDDFCEKLRSDKRIVEDCWI